MPTGLGTAVSKPFRACSTLLAPAFLALFSASSHATEPYVNDYEFLNTDVLLRISSQSHNSGIHEAAKELATLFNWQQLPDEFDTVGQQRAIPISTASAEASLNDLLQGRAELAIVRADLADSIFSQVNEENELATQSLRLVSTHIPQFLHIVVRSDYEGATVKSLDFKRVNIGGKSEKIRRNFTTMLAEAGSFVDSLELSYAPVPEALNRLDAGALDAVIFFDQAPSNLVSSKLASLEYRLLPYTAIRDGSGVNESVASNTTYFGQAVSTDFYQMPESVRSTTVASYLLTREGVPQAAMDSVVHILDVRPQLDNPAKSNSDIKDGSQTGNTVAPRERPFSISVNLSPIPLHPSSQLLIDIFSDPASSFTDGLAVENRELNLQ